MIHHEHGRHTIEVAIHLAPRLAEAVKNLVDEGWHQDAQSVVNEAVRRYIASHRPELLERFILEDVERGLRGTD